MLKIAEKWQSSWGGADSARKEETRNSGCILRLREWGCHVISHLGVPDQGAYGSRPQTHPPPTPGAPKDHPSSTKIAICRYPRGGGRNLPGKRKRGILAVSRLREWGCHVIFHLGVPDQGTYGFGPSNHHPPTPGAPKDHHSSTKIARCRYPRGGGRNLPG